MCLVYAEVDLINGDDLALVRRNIIGEEELKKMRINMLVDSGAIMLAINENIQEQLQFPVVANSSIVECEVVAPVEVRFKKQANFLPGYGITGKFRATIRAIPLDGGTLMPMK